MKKWILVAGVVVALAAVIAIAPAVLAQGPGSGNGPGDGSGPIGDGPFGPGQGSGPGFGGGPGGGMFRMGGPENSPVAVAAEILGMEQTDLVAELQAGATIADLAAEQGVDLQTIVDAVIAPRAERLADLVAEGQLTQDEADALLAQMTENVTARLSEPFTPRGFGQGQGFTDADGDGVCDNMGSGAYAGVRRGGRMGGWGR